MSLALKLVLSSAPVAWAMSARIAVQVPDQ
jgi:hypothetical protein